MLSLYAALLTHNKLQERDHVSTQHVWERTQPPLLKNNLAFLVQWLERFTSTQFAMKRSPVQFG